MEIAGPIPAEWPEFRQFVQIHYDGKPYVVIPLFATNVFKAHPTDLNHLPEALRDAETALMWDAEIMVVLDPQFDDDAGGMESTYYERLFALYDIGSHTYYFRKQAFCPASENPRLQEQQCLHRKMASMRKWHPHEVALHLHCHLGPAVKVATLVDMKTITRDVGPLLHAMHARLHQTDERNPFGLKEWTCTIFLAYVIEGIVSDEDTGILREVLEVWPPWFYQKAYKHVNQSLQFTDNTVKRFHSKHALFEDLVRLRCIPYTTSGTQICFWTIHATESVELEIQLTDSLPNVDEGKLIFVVEVTKKPRKLKGTIVGFYNVSNAVYSSLVVPLDDYLTYKYEKVHVRVPAYDWFVYIRNRVFAEFPSFDVFNSETSAEALAAVDPDVVLISRPESWTDYNRAFDFASFIKTRLESEGVDHAFSVWADTLKIVLGTPPEDAPRSDETVRICDRIIKLGDERYPDAASLAYLIDYYVFHWALRGRLSEYEVRMHLRHGAFEQDDAFNTYPLEVDVAGIVDDCEEDYPDDEDAQHAATVKRIELARAAVISIRAYKDVLSSPRGVWTTACLVLGGAGSSGGRRVSVRHGFRGRRG